MKIITNKMLHEAPTQGTQLAQLATFLLSRREAIMGNWRTICEADASLSIVDGLTREEFTDQVPSMLDVLGKRLKTEVEALAPYQIAREHGLHRWHKGYSLHEILSEIAHLHETLLAELRLFWSQSPKVEHVVLMTAYQQVSSLMHEAIGGSIAQYD
ncbi:MAG: hypothetical protein EOO39_23580, partial [Cytophagaceae bacterium]